MNYRPETLAMIRAKMPVLQADLLAEGKPLSFFGLLLRETNFNLWDVVVAAPWIDDQKKKTLSYLGKKLNTHLKPSEMMAISRIAPIKFSDPRWKQLVDQYFPDADGPDIVFVKNEVLFDMDMDAAVLFRPSTGLRPRRLEDAPNITPRRGPAKTHRAGRGDDAR